MATDDDDFALNSLHRFRKHSRLVLETHSHCEVPAGCGGVVLQWRDPAGELNVLVQLSSSHDLARMAMDGVELRTSRATIGPGPHVLAFELGPPRERKRGLPPFLMAAVGTGDLMRFQALPGALSDASRGWRFCTSAPAAGWANPDFDDRAWSEVLASTSSLDIPLQLDRYILSGLLERGAKPLHVPADRTWWRLRFEVTA